MPHSTIISEAFWRSVFDFCLYWLSSQEWYIVIGIAILFLLGLLTWKVLEPGIIQKRAKAIQRTKRAKTTSKQTPLFLGRIVLGLPLVLSTIWVLNLFLYAVHVRLIASNLTSIQRNVLMSADAYQRNNPNRDFMRNITIGFATIDAFKSIPPNILDPAIVQARERLIELKLFEDRPYKSRGEAIGWLEIITKTSITPLGKRVSAFLLSQQPSVPLLSG